MDVSSCLMLLLLGALYCLGTTFFHFSLGKRSDFKDFAVVRPTSPEGLSSLLQSFSLWKEYPPCRARVLNVDLVISISRQSEESQAYLSAIEEEMVSTNGWGHCFRDILFLDAKIPEDLDIYDESIQLEDRLWVNGPNVQFRSLFKDMFDLDSYEAFFLMESDTYPQRNYWLDALVEEVLEARPFGTLGSEYQGRIWEEFADLMPFALVHHINGNAIYNLSSTLLRKMVQEMEDEKDTFYSAVSYDYRLSQMVAEAQMGKPSVFPFPGQLRGVNMTQALPNKQGRFKALWKEYGGNSRFYMQSSIIGNFGAVKSIVEDTKDFVLVHGKQYNPSISSPATHAGRKLQVVCPTYAPDCLETTPLLSTVPSDVPSDMPSTMPSTVDIDAQ